MSSVLSLYAHAYISFHQYHDVYACSSISFHQYYNLYAGTHIVYIYICTSAHKYWSTYTHSFLFHFEISHIQATYTYLFFHVPLYMCARVKINYIHTNPNEIVYKMCVMPLYARAMHCVIYGKVRIQCTAFYMITRVFTL